MGSHQFGTAALCQAVKQVTQHASDPQPVSFLSVPDLRYHPPPLPWLAKPTPPYFMLDRA